MTNWTTTTARAAAGRGTMTRMTTARPAGGGMRTTTTPRRGQKKGNLGLILGIVAGVLVLVCGGGGVGLYFLFKGATAKVGEAAERQSSANNLKQIGLGVLNYESRHGELPNNSYSPDGKPLLSWRVHLLPYIEEEALYRQFHLDEPWDSPNNKPLLARMPKVYATPARAQRQGPTRDADLLPRVLEPRGDLRQAEPRPAPRHDASHGRDVEHHPRGGGRVGHGVDQAR